MKYLLLLIALLIAVPVYSGGLIEEEDTPVPAGIKKKYLRSPYIGISNKLNEIPMLEFTIERAKIDVDGETSTQFLRRNMLNGATYTGMKIPQIDPTTGNQDGTFRNDLFYKMVYSLTILTEKARKTDKYPQGQVGIIPNSSPVTLCYTTHSSTECVLPPLEEAPQ